MEHLLAAEPVGLRRRLSEMHSDVMASRTTRLLILLSLVLAGAAAAAVVRPNGGASAAVHRQGTVTGMVVRTGACSVIRAERPCPTYAVAGARIALLRNGQVVARARSDAAGRFRVTADAGRVVVRVRGTFGGYVGRGSREAMVRAGDTTHVRLRLDNGVR